MRPVSAALLVAELTTFGLLASGMVASSLAGAGTQAPVTVAGSTTPAPRDVPACADVLLLAARGSDEADRAPSGQQFGATVDGFRQVYARVVAAQGRTLEQRAVDFTAPKVRVLRPDGVRSSTPAVRAVRKRLVRTWRSGVTHGVDAAVTTLTAAATACPDQQLVLVGYGQGAMVMHRTLLRLADRPDIVERVTGAALVADGDRSSAPAAARLVGAPAPGGGAGLSARVLTGVPGVPVAGTHVAVWNVCSTGDIACDLRANTLRDAFHKHRSYRSGKGLAKVQAVASHLGARAGRWPLPPAAAVQAAGQVGMLMDRQLTARVSPRDADNVVWADAEGLPPGVQLTSDGHLRGIPSAAGTYDISYTVHNGASAAFRHRFPGQAQVTVVETGADTISAGGTQTCQTRDDGKAYCWGRNNWGQFGNGTRTDSRTPVEVGRGWRSLSTSGSATCGVKDDGSLWCWGLNQYGQLGDGTRTTRLSPVRIGTSTKWATVSTGWAHTCATKTNGTAWCWGNNGAGQLGNGTTRNRLTPKRVGDATNWLSVSAGGWFTCGVTADGKGWCWGANAFGQLGNGSLGGSTVPTAVGFTSDWAAISASWAGACGLKTDGELRCWGLNDQGQVGDGTTQDRRYPALVAGGKRYRSVSVGDAHACAITTDADLECWGDNVYGQLGDGTRRASAVPVTSGGAGGWYSVDAGWLHTCGVRQDGTTWCWGNSEFGQVGDGTLRNRKGAVPVS